MLIQEKDVLYALMPCHISGLGIEGFLGFQSCVGLRICNDATLTNHPATQNISHQWMLIIQAAVHGRRKNMQDPPVAGKAALLIDKQSILRTQPVV